MQLTVLCGDGPLRGPSPGVIDKQRIHRKFRKENRQYWRLTNVRICGIGVFLYGDAGRLVPQGPVSLITNPGSAGAAAREAVLGRRGQTPAGSVPGRICPRGRRGLKPEQINKLAEKAAFRLFLKSLFRELPLPFFVFLHDLLAQGFGIFAVGVDIMERFSE